jgi:hypothetical protein
MFSPYGTSKSARTFPNLNDFALEGRFALILKGLSRLREFFPVTLKQNVPRKRGKGQGVVQRPRVFLTKDANVDGGSVSAFEYAPNSNGHVGR